MPTNVSVSPGAGHVMNSSMLWGISGSPISLTAPLLTLAVAGLLAVYVPGTYTNATGVNLQWYKNGVAVPGATSAIYVSSVGDLGTTLKVVETPYNANGPGTPVSSSIITVTLS